MQDKLVVFLSTRHIAQLSWVLVSDGAVVGDVVHQDNGPATLTQMAQGKEVVVIVPAEDVLLGFCKHCLMRWKSN